LETEAWKEVDVPKGRVRQNLGLWILWSVVLPSTSGHFSQHSNSQGCYCTKKQLLVGFEKGLPL
jgi:hypothetical protein